MKSFGVAFSWREKSLEDILVCARCAEQAGMDSIWISEAWGRDAFLALAEVAHATNRVKLGTGIVNVYSRSPATLAMSAATLDELSKGRAILGVGSSGPSVVERWHGIRYKDPLNRVRETVEIVRLALSGAPTNFQGQVFRVSDFKLAMNSPEHVIPIYVAALGQRMLRLAGEIGEGVLLYLCPLTRIPDAINEIRKGASEAKRSLDDIDIAAMLPTYISENHKQAQDYVARTIAYYVGGMGTYYRRLIGESGFQSEADRIRDAWQRGDRMAATKAVSEKLIQSVALTGPPDECRRRLAKFRDAGITLPIISFYIKEQGGSRTVCESIRALAGE